MRIVIADSGSITGKLLQFALVESGESVTVASTPAIAIDQATGFGTDAVIVNADFDGGRGAAFCTALRSRAYMGPLLVWGERRRDSLLAAYDSGIDDFIIEPFDPREALARLRAVMRRFERFDNRRLGLLRVGTAELSVGKLTFKVSDGPEIPLSPVEMRILEVLMRNRGVVLSPLTLMRHVWDGDETVGTNRVQVYVMRLRRKIEPEPDRPRFIHTIRGLGYVFRDEQQTQAVPSDWTPNVVDIEAQ